MFKTLRNIIVDKIRTLRGHGKVYHKKRVQIGHAIFLNNITLSHCNIKTTKLCSSKNKKSRIQNRKYASMFEPQCSLDR